MAELVTLAQANLALKLDLTQSGSPLEFTDARTPDIELKLDQAEGIILDYLKAAADGWTSETAPVQVTASILRATQALYESDDAILAGLYDNDRANPIVGMLQRLRDPALA